MFKLRAKNINPTISFINLRKLIGILGMILPLACYLGGKLFSGLNLQPSISSYYYTNARDIFVGVLVGVSMFLVTYRGYELIDDIVSTTTGIAGLGIAIFPCLLQKVKFDEVGLFQIIATRSNILHTLCAGIFFTLLAVNSIFIFTLTDKKSSMTKNKKIRNIVYIACGVIIIVTIVVMVVLNIVFKEAGLENSPIIFILETILLEAFGISWLVKGKTILKDKRVK